MKVNEGVQETMILELTEDERHIVVFLRTLQLDRNEAIRRLATPVLPSTLPAEHELEANMPAVTRDPMTIIPGEK